MIYRYRHQVYAIILIGLLSTVALALDKILAADSVSAENPAKVFEGAVAADNKQVNASQNDHAISDQLPLKSVQIRVLLDEARDDQPFPSWRLMAKNGFTILNQTVENASQLDSEIVLLHHNNGRWYLDNKAIKPDRLLLRAHEGSMRVDGVPYYGSLFIVIEPHRLLLINCLDLEDYVFSVLAAEGFPGWPLEMNKVQAIAIRTYAASMIYKNTGKKCLYHIKNTNVHQCYNGKPNSVSLRAAVDQTRGIILTYDNEPVIAMYDICCGGIIPAKMRGVNFKVAPFLARTKACTYCVHAKEYGWQVSYLKKEMEAILKNSIARLGRLRMISVFRKDKAGLVRDVEIIGTGGYFYLKSEKIYSIVKGVRSTCFEIEVTPKKIIFKGRGYGHLKGMCQRGACEMIRGGADYRTVLKFYYPGTHFMKIKEKGANE